MKKITSEFYKYLKAMNWFDNRNRLKKKLHLQVRKVYLKEREIRYAHLGCNIGFEENGKWKEFVRPVIILKRVWNQFVIVPLTTKGKDNQFYRELPSQLFQRRSFAIVPHIKALDRKRFSRRIAILDEKNFWRLKEKLKTVLF